MIRLGVAAVLAFGAACEKDPTGAGPIQPPHDPALGAYSDPIWTADGKYLGFIHTPLETILVQADGRHRYVYTDSLSGFWMIDADGSNMRRVLSFAPYEPDWGPTGGWMTYGRYGDIWKMKMTSSGLDSSITQRLTFRGACGFPSWDPTESWVLFTYRPGSPIRNLLRVWGGGGALQYIGDPGWGYSDWSPDGSQIIFVAEAGSAQGIWVADSLGRGARLLRPGLAQPLYPRWSPDGSKIAFTAQSLQTEKHYLWVMGSDGSAAYEATADGVTSGFAWAPDSRRIAYVRYSFDDYSMENGTIWVVDLQTGLRQQVTRNGRGWP